SAFSATAVTSTSLPGMSVQWLVQVLLSLFSAPVIEVSGSPSPEGSVCSTVTSVISPFSALTVIGSPKGTFSAPSSGEMEMTAFSAAPVRSPSPVLHAVARRTAAAPIAPCFRARGKGERGVTDPPGRLQRGERRGGSGKGAPPHSQTRGAGDRFRDAPNWPE